MHLLASNQSLNTQPVDDCTLGLSIVQRIIERHHGKVWADITLDGEMLLLFSLPADVADTGI